MNDPIAELKEQMKVCKVNYKTLYFCLLMSCLKLDMNYSANEINENTRELLSAESRMLLKYQSRDWGISEAYQIIAYLELLFLKYQIDEVSTTAIMHALEAVHNMKRKSGWLTTYDVTLLQLFHKNNKK